MRLSLEVAAGRAREARKRRFGQMDKSWLHVSEKEDFYDLTLAHSFASLDFFDRVANYSTYNVQY